MKKNSMIDYNYKIERIVNDKGSIKTFVPTKIPTSLPDITYIEGPNSSGKSTLLNIIAIALYGQKNSTIIESLKKKMNSLMDAGHQKLSFEFKITNKSGNLELEGKKTADNNDISLYHYIDGKRKPLGPENFDQNYNLIYNIPFNPTDRLSSLTDGIEKSQLLYSNALSQLRFKLTEYISEITKKDPKKIETLKKRFKNLSADVKKTEDTLPILTKKLDLLETAVYFELYHKYQKELNEIQSEINEIGNNITKTVKKVKKGSKAYIAAKFSTKLGIDAIDLTFNKICNNIRSIIQMGKFPKRKELSDILNLSRDIAFVSTLESLEFPTNLTYIITQASELLKVIRGSVDPNLLNEAKMYKELLQVLNLYQNLEATLPGDKSIKDFITELKNIYDEKQGIVDLCAKIDATKELLVNISQKISVITQTDFPTLRKLKRDISDAEEEVETKKGDVEKDNRLHVLKTQEKECLKFLKEYEKKYASKGSPPPHEVCRLGFGELKEYFKMDEALLLNTIETLRKQIAQKTADKMQKEAFLPGIEKEIHDIEIKEILCYPF